MGRTPPRVAQNLRRRAHSVAHFFIISFYTSCLYIGIRKDTSKDLAEWFSIDLTHRGQRFDSSNS